MTQNPSPEHESLLKATRLVLNMLPSTGQTTQPEIDANVDLVLGMLGHVGQAPDREILVRHVQSLVSIWQSEATTLEDPADHVEWLPQARADENRKWEFWERYRRYLEDEKPMPPKVVRNLDRATDSVLKKLEDPRRGGRWHRRGLVVGQVQSGKTGHYIGLACKAADAGYKLIVVLAGLHNSLRSQTQLRVDEGLIGGDTQYQQRYDEGGAGRPLGVGAMAGAPRLKVASLTHSAEDGDFRLRAAAHANIPIGDYPVILVVKKHRRVLDYLRKWVIEVEGEPVGEGSRKVVHDIPLLMIDDEADNASVHTGDDDTNPTRVNAAIRELLNSFDRFSYVGYTATPFANIYINPDANDDVFGSDLFPTSFIQSFPAPSNYLGPERVFGLCVDDPDEDDIEPLPIVRHIKDHTTWMPDGHRSDWDPPEQIPQSLRKAINSFVLSCAARRARGQGDSHNSMLVHVTRFTAVQKVVYEQVDEYLGLLADRLRDTYGPSSEQAHEELRQLWETDFGTTTAAFPAEDAPRLSWQQVEASLRPSLAKIQVREINGTSRDALDYYENRSAGLSVIAIGGDKLSRGLTLEGLTVSYYLRASKTYDTLLQMGRWFGYRPGYEDLCRLYTTPTLQAAYLEITAADNELRRDLEEMAGLDMTPTQFGLRVRTSSVGLGITAANKMRRGVRVKLSYSGSLAETTTFSLQPDRLRSNYENLERFISALGTPTEDEGGGPVWRSVTPEQIVDGFFDGYVADARAQRVRPAYIAEYIRKCVHVGELGDWTVRLVSSATAKRQQNIASHSIGLIKRSDKQTGKADEYIIGRVLSPKDEATDLDESQEKTALAATRRAAQGKKDRHGRPRDPQVPTGPPLREQRRADQALLLIYPLDHPAEKEPGALPVVGFAVSFPVSRHRQETEYVVNDIWRQQEIDHFDDEDIEG